MLRLVVAAPLLLSAVHALPRVEHQHSTSAWSAFSSAWDIVRGSALGWYSTDVFDQLEQTLHNAPEKSVFQWLDSNPDFSNITRLIKHDDEIKELLDEASHGLTFLAPNNKALTPPHHHQRKDVESIEAHHEDALTQILLHADDLFTDDKKDDKDEEKKKKMLKAILNAILRYHILPYDTTSTGLGVNSTVQTNLIPKDGSYNGQNRRIKVEHALVPPSLKFNGYATVVHGDNKATNGAIHEIDHPLLPPPSILNLAHLFPQWLSTFTSAIQKVGLEDAIDWHYVHKEGGLKPHFAGAPAVTVFIPDNDAWKKLPEKLVIYLFSPFGKKALTKLLQFHVVPNFIVHAEWIHLVKHPKEVEAEGVELDFSFPFPTALKNYTLPVHIKKTTPTIPVPGLAYFEFHVLGESVEGKNLDIVARNGAVHIVPSVLNPHKSKHPEEDAYKTNEEAWENWEEWLPEWVDEE